VYDNYKLFEVRALAHQGRQHFTAGSVMLWPVPDACFFLCLPPAAQIEIDFKAECKAGELVEGACMPLTSEGQPPASSNGNGQHAPSSSQQQSSSLQFLHTLRRCDESGCYELVRCRTTWKK
jgi:hypothetical protein